MPKRRFAILLLVVAGLGIGMMTAQTQQQITITKLTVLNGNPSVAVGTSVLVSAQGTYSDGTSGFLSGGGGAPVWQVIFSPQIDVSPCMTQTTSNTTYLSQNFGVNSDGSFHAVWQPANPNTLAADGVLTPASITASLKCAQFGSRTGSMSAAWNGTNYTGTYSFTNNGNVTIFGTVWTSSNPSVATVDATGSVTAKAAGSTTITAVFGSTCPPQAFTSAVSCSGTVSGSTVITVVPSSTTVTVTNPTGASQNNSDNNDQNAIKSGYVVVTPISGATTGALDVVETFGLKEGDGTEGQAAVLPASMTTNALLFVNTNTQIGRDLGFAVVDPGTSNANLTLTLHKNDGTFVAVKTLTVSAGTQTAKFISDIFSDQAAALVSFTGSVSILSDQPVAMMGLRFRGTGFSTIPVTSLSSALSVPTIAAGVGGTSAVILPHFAQDGGWSTEINILNSTSATLTVRVDFFGADGKPIQVTMNGTTQNSFRVAVAPSGVMTLSPLDASGLSRF